MGHRTQLDLDEAQYRWLQRQSKHAGSIAQVVRDLIDEARASRADVHSEDTDPLLALLLDHPPSRGRRSETTVTTIDADVYGP